VAGGAARLADSEPYGCFGHWLRHGQSQHAHLRSSLLLLPVHSGRLAVSSSLSRSYFYHSFCYRLYAALSGRRRWAGPARHLDTLLPASAHCRGATTTAVFATGSTPRPLRRPVGPARHLYKVVPTRLCTPYTPPFRLASSGLSIQHPPTPYATLSCFETDGGLAAFLDADLGSFRTSVTSTPGASGPRKRGRLAAAWAYFSVSHHPSWSLSVSPLLT
jgi:hypothetical protein